MKVSAKAQYAIMAMVDLATTEKDRADESCTPSSLTAVSERQNLPLPYMEQLFLKLRKAGLVKSARGAGGGYVLGRTASNIRVYDIIVAVEKPIKMTRCADGSGGCQPNGARCVAHDLWEELGDMIQFFLKSVTLDDLQNKNVRGNRMLGRGRDSLVAHEDYA
ncbi:MAG: Rrf2 family transcriptional regulator [Alphaproteobacteria bacterium]|nr:Rrf2 family transcriptional regulator [Alphaproteobacteria bacterium]